MKKENAKIAVTKNCKVITPIQKVIFINRAYNDFDTYAPLLDAFAADPSWNVEVLASVADGQCAFPDDYETMPYFKKFR